MKISTILFDLDGTLLPLDQDLFLKKFFELLTKKLTPFGYTYPSLWAGAEAMIKNAGEKTNEKAYFDAMEKFVGNKVYSDKKHFDEFYEKEYNDVKIACKRNELIPQIIKKLKEMNFNLSIATNPVFPRIAVEKRISWAEIDINDFELVTTYENYHYCKPNKEYFLEIAKKLNVNPEECLMVGNDAIEDVGALDAGMKVFLVTDYLENKKNINISNIPNGTFNDLMDYVNSLG